MKHGPCPFGHKGILQTLPDGRGRLCPCAGGALYDGDKLVGPQSLIAALDRLVESLALKTTQETAPKPVSGSPGPQNRIL